MATPALRRTVRRATAVLLVQLAAISAQLYEIRPSGDGSIATFVTIPLVVGALCYLLGSVLYAGFRPRGETE